MRIGILGGTFDPVHYGHLLLAEQCREQCELDEVWFVPAAHPPHKSVDSISDGRFRVEMLEFALAGCPHLNVNRMELAREGPNFTVDTLSLLAQEDPTRELFFLIGGDSLADLPTWREPERIARLATIVAVNRGDRPLPDDETQIERLGAAVAARTRTVSIPGIELAGSDIRRRVRESRSIRFMTPRAVEVYIHEKQLYKGS